MFRLYKPAPSRGKRSVTEFWRLMSSYGRDATATAADTVTDADDRLGDLTGALYDLLSEVPCERQAGSCHLSPGCGGVMIACANALIVRYYGAKLSVKFTL